MGVCVCLLSRAQPVLLKFWAPWDPHGSWWSELGSLSRAHPLLTDQCPDEGLSPVHPVTSQLLTQGSSKHLGDSGWHIYHTFVGLQNNNNFHVSILWSSKIARCMVCVCQSGPYVNHLLQITIMGTSAFYKCVYIQIQCYMSALCSHHIRLFNEHLQCQILTTMCGSFNWAT